MDWSWKDFTPANKVCEGYVFTGVCLSTGGSLSQGVSILRGLCPRGSLSRGFSVQGVSVQGGVSVQVGSLSRWVSVQGVSMPKGVSVQGGLCPGGFHPWGGLCPRGSLSRGVSVHWVSVWGISIQKGLYLGGSVEGSLSWRPPPRMVKSGLKPEQHLTTLSPRKLLWRFL